MPVEDLPKVGSWLRLDGHLVALEKVSPVDGGFDLVVRHVDGRFSELSLPEAQLKASRVPDDDGKGDSDEALAGLWGRWMQFASPRLRSAALATKSLKPYAHQDEAVFDYMLAQPRLRFLLADEPGTGKTIMTGMYLVEAKRRGLLQGQSLIVVPAHLVPKWQEDLEDFFGIRAGVLTPEIARGPMDLDPRVEIWLASLDLFTYNPDVHRKAAGAHSSWSLAVFDEAHRLTPTAQYLRSARDLSDKSHHLLLLTATPHRGKEHYFRALCNLLDGTLYPWSEDGDDYAKPLRPSRLSFLRRMKEDLKNHDGSPLFPQRFAETVPVRMSPAEYRAYDAVMIYASEWYGENATLALTIYGKRAASSLYAVDATVRRRLGMLQGAASKRGIGFVPDTFAQDGERSFSERFENPEDLERAEDVVVAAKTKDKQGETEAVKMLLDTIELAMCDGQSSKWIIADTLLSKHGIKPKSGQLLVFSEYADTARWLVDEFRAAGYTAEILQGAVNHKERYRLQQRFLNAEFQILVSTDAGGEGINLQSAHVMIDWDIPWSLVRLEQRMGRLHRIGQQNDVYIYHLVASETREGRVQEVILRNLEEAAKSLGGRIFDLLDATVSRVDGGIDFARMMTQAQIDPAKPVVVPDAAALTKAAESLMSESKHLRSKVDQQAADARFRADRLSAINPVMVNGFVDALARSEGWKVGPGPAEGIRTLKSASKLPKAFGGVSDCLIAADSKAVDMARSGAAGVDDVVVLGPTEPVFTELVAIAVDDGRLPLLRGSCLLDTGSISDYVLFLYEADVRMHDGVRPTSLSVPILVRWSGSGAFEVSWESVMKLRAAGENAEKKPAPAQVSEGLVEAKAALAREIERQRVERVGWVNRAKLQLNELEDRFLDEIAELPKAARQGRQADFNEQKKRRLEQLNVIGTVKASGVRPVGWVQVKAGVTIDKLGYNPTAEKVAIAKVWAELEAQDFGVDDRQTAYVGYDLLARNSRTGDQRCVEVKGFTKGMEPVCLEQNEWAQAQQRGDDYWLYVVENCEKNPTVAVRVQNPAAAFGGGLGKIQRFQIKLSQLREHSSKE